MKLASLFRAPVAPELDPDLTWPSVENIFAAQQIAVNEDLEKQHKISSDSVSY